MTVPFLSIWIIEGGRTQQSAMGGFSPKRPSTSSVSFGRVWTQTLSSLSTASPVMPPSFHLFGRGLGQLASHLYRGISEVFVTAHGSFAAFCARATKKTHKTNMHIPARAAALTFTLQSFF